MIIVPNFSLGSVLATSFAAMASRFYDSIEIIEAHHEGKIDSPSGTAVRTAELIGEARDGLGPVIAPHADQRARGQQVSSVPIHSLRMQGVVAKQQVLLGGVGEQLTISHDTLSPAAYEAGILLALRALPAHARRGGRARPADRHPRHRVKRIAVAIMAALLVLYLLFTVQYAVILILDGQPVTLALGIALLVLPILGFWALIVEVRFMVRAQRLARTLEAEGGMPDEQLPLLPSGRVDREAADEVFPRYQGEVEADPDSWRAWFRLGVAYEASGDRRRARWATRRAIELARQ